MNGIATQSLKGEEARRVTPSCLGAQIQFMSHDLAKRYIFKRNEVAIGIRHEAFH